MRRQLKLGKCGVCKLDRVVKPNISCRYRRRRNSRVGRSRFCPRVVGPRALRHLPSKRIKRLIFAALAGRKVPLLHCHAGSLASLVRNRYPYKEAGVHVSNVMNHDSSVLVVHNVGIFPSRIRDIVLSVPRFRPRCVLIISEGGGLSSLRMRIRIHGSFFSSSVKDVLTVGGTLDSGLGDILSVDTRIGLVRPGDVTHDRNGDGHIVSGQVLGWGDVQCSGRTVVYFSKGRGQGGG